MRWWGFDVYTGECRIVFRVTSTVKGGISNANLLESTVSKGTAKKTSVLPRASAMAVIAAAAGSNTGGADTDIKSSKVSPLSLPSLRSYLRTEDGLPTLDEQFVKELTATASSILGKTEKEDELLSSSSPASISGFLCCRESYVITAGSDRVVRYWDLREPTGSYRISSDKLGIYNIRYNARIENNTMVFEEVLGMEGDVTDPKAAGGPGGGGLAGGDDEKAGAAAAAAAVKLQMTKRYGPVPPMTAHQEEIVDIRAIEYPVKMLATCSRDGAVKIWV